MESCQLTSYQNDFSRGTFLLFSRFFSLREFEFTNNTLDSDEDCKIMAKGSYATFGHHFALKYNNHNSHKINEKDQEVFTQYNDKCCSHLNCNYEVIEMALYYTQCNYELQYMLL